MRKSSGFNTQVKRNRVKRHGGEIFREASASFLLICSIILTTSLLVFGWDRVVRSDLFAIRETAVRGCSELTSKDILSLAGIRPNAKLFTINKEAIIQRVKKNPWIKDVFVGREFPGRMVIFVRERKPVALIEKNSELYFLDDGGDIFKRLELEEKADLPVLTGFSSGYKVNQDLINKSLALLNHLKTAKDIPDLGLISEIHGDETFGFSLFTNKGLCLELGFEGYETKIKSLNRVMSDLKKKNFNNALLLIDLRNPGKITVQARGTFRKEGFGLPKAEGEKLQI